VTLSKTAGAPAEPLQLGDIQAITLTGYGHLRHAAYLFLRLPRVGGDMCDPNATITPEAHSLLKTTARLANGAKIAPTRAEREKSAINVAFTFDGLAALGLSSATLQSFPPEFQGGMTQDYRARALGDTGTNSPEYWQWGGTKPGLAKNGDQTQAVDLEKLPDLLLLCYAELASQLDAMVADLKSHWVACGAVVIADERAEPDMHDSREHFGFRDNITSVHIDGGFGVKDPGQSIVPAGEFVLGYKNAYGQYTATPCLDGSTDIGKNGTYLVFRKLVQDVPAFWKYCETIAANLPNPTADAIPPEFIGAKMVGRWRSGAPLALCPFADDPALALDSDLVNNFGYSAEDPKGFGCPMGAHMRRANPRDTLSTLDPAGSRVVVDHHRVLRRARSYGAPYEDPTTAEPDGEERGLLFFCVSADIARQFEFVQQTWMMDPKFADMWNEPDPITGQEANVYGDPATGAEFTIPQKTGRIRLRSVPQFITVAAGAYFFLPGIAALQRIVDG